MSLRIAFFVHSFPETSETFILRQATGLCDRGHTVDIFADRTPAPSPVHEEVVRYGFHERTRYLSPPSGNRRFRESWASAVALFQYRGFVLRYLTRGTRGTRRLGRDLSDLTRLKSLGSLPRYDVVHCHFGDMALRYRFAAVYWGAPLVASFYGFDCSSYPRIEGAHVYAPLFRSAAAVTALSQHMAARLVGLGCLAERLHTLHIGVNPERFRPGEPRSEDPSQPVRLLTVARLAEKKGIEFALRAVALAVARYPHMQYDVIGDGPLRNQLATLASALGLADRVRFHGAQTEAFVLRAMQQADIFLLPSVTAADDDEEGTPTVLMEAASCELPVVSSLHSGIPEVVLNGQSGLLVPQRDVVALAGALERLIGDPDLRRRMGRTGRCHVQAQYNTQLLSEQLESLYEQVLCGPFGSSQAAVHHQSMCF